MTVWEGSVSLDSLRTVGSTNVAYVPRDLWCGTVEMVTGAQREAKQVVRK